MSAAEEKKPKASKEKKTKTASHPPYFQMIKEALLALKEKNGSSPYAIAKFMEEKFKSVLPANFKKMLNLQLKNQAARGKLVKIKASYKLSEAEKPKKEKKSTKVTKGDVAEKKEQRQKRKRNVTVGGTKSKKNEAVKKVVKKKKSKKVSGPGKPKQPKSIKSNNNKRARKATVANA
ncbi:histone H1 [Trifolium pratense]|uniref:Histone H1 n=1 Tax=Trifolium pratense TaxID=57577 RepID=A0A2K3M5R8_TRIPR|nr:histone H1 [Trifolium pratense]PNX85600.1 histone H1 [Trifolium pratense]PNX86120.1 histone H1 [Trifolium pratense]